MKGTGRGTAGSMVRREKRTASDARAARQSHSPEPDAAAAAADAAAPPPVAVPAGTGVEAAAATEGAGAGRGTLAAAVRCSTGEAAAGTDRGDTACPLARGVDVSAASRSRPIGRP